MSEEQQFNTIVGGQTITIATGKLAGQAGGAVTVRQADTVMLATATMSNTPREGIDFFPLSVDYEERLYAGGRIPGSFFRREGRPSEAAIITGRLTDRPIRPLFPQDMRNDVQVILYAISSDGETPIDILGINGASAALMISNIPFGGPVGAVRIGRIHGDFVINPTYQQLNESDLDLRVAGTRDAVLMVECGANELDEAVMLAALEMAHREIQPLIDIQEEMRAKVGKPKSDYPVIRLPEEVLHSVGHWLGSRMKDLLATPREKVEIALAYEDFAAAAVEALETDELDETTIRSAVSEIHKKDVRDLILNERRRIDGRGPKDIREIRAEVDLSPRAHGSGLFSRGETQVLTLAT